MLSFGDSSSSIPVSSNIQRYLSHATLPRLRLAPCAPRLPPANHKSHKNHLTIRQGECRRFIYVHRIKREYMEVRCLNFIRKHAPNAADQALDIDTDEYESPSIHCVGFDVQAFPPSPVKHIEGLSIMWLEDKILRTVQAVLHMIPEYREIIKSYSFTRNDIMRDEDQQIFRYFMWERSNKGGANRGSKIHEPPVKLILAYQPPWILGQRDIELFADKRLKGLPSWDEKDGAEQHPYNSSQKLWAKLWDICKVNGCHWFILTNYNQWAFGGFSKVWESGFSLGARGAYETGTRNITPSKSEDKTKSSWYRTPSILELIVYWTVSSMNLPDRFEVPPVPKEITLERAIDESSHVTDFQAPVDKIDPQGSEPTCSEMSFGSSTEVPSSAGVRIRNESESGWTPPPFLDEDWRAEVGREVSTRNATNVRSWLKKTSPPGVVEPPTIPRAPSPVRSEWSDLSLATAQPRKYQGFHNIDTVIMEEVYEYEV